MNGMKGFLIGLGIGVGLGLLLAPCAGEDAREWLCPVADGRHGPYCDARVAASASGLYARNLFSFIETMIDKANKALAVNWDDELVKATALTKDGAVIHPNFQPK